MTTKRVENSWVLLVAESLLSNESFSIVTLPHPAHGQPTKYCLDDKNNKIYEIVTFSESNRSWFIDNTVKSDGSLLILTPIRPLFLILPKLRKQSHRAIPIENLLSEKGFNKITNFIEGLDKVADRKGSPELNAYKYNEEKTLAWLEERVRKLSQTLRKNNIHVTSGSVSATFVQSSFSNADINEEFYVRYAHGILSEYLEDELVDKLEKRMNFKPELIESLGEKRKAEVNESDQINKRIKYETNTENEFNGSINQHMVKVKPLTAKEKARQKAASRTKTISSFFSKK